MIGFNNRDPSRNRSDVNALVALIFLHFMPTFTVMCYGFSWLCCAYYSEAGAYCMAVAPIAYLVLWFMWVYSEIGRSKRGLSIGCCGCDGAGREERSADAVAMQRMDPIDRIVYKNQLRERNRALRAINGSLLGRDTDYYDACSGSPVMRRAALEAMDRESPKEREFSPYLKERLDRDIAEEREMIQVDAQRQVSALRQKRFNKAYDIHRSRLEAGEHVGPFIFEGEIIPMDDDERRRLEAIRAAGAIAIYE